MAQLCHGGKFARPHTGSGAASLDTLNFLLADVRGALGPYLNVFLITQQHWPWGR